MNDIPNENEKASEQDLVQEDEKKILAQNIAFFRKKIGISQTELAARLQYSNKNVSKWECGETTPDVFTLKKLADIFGITIDVLLTKIAPETQDAIKTKKPISLKWKINMLLLTNALFFLGCCIAFFVLVSCNVSDFEPALLFLYSLPFMDISVFIFICCVKKKCDWISLSLFGWLAVLCFFVTFYSAKNIGYIFIIALGWQVLAPTLSALINSGKFNKINKLILGKLKKTQTNKNPSA